MVSHHYHFLRNIWLLRSSITQKRTGFLITSEQCLMCIVDGSYWKSHWLAIECSDLSLCTPILAPCIFHLYYFTTEIIAKDKSSYFKCYCYSVFILYQKWWSKISQRLRENALEKQANTNMKLAINVSSV